ncbi:carbohydrate sulfotransferase 9-like [Penaeus chinensis]|uniref:carbohydrate sulfotransferase 9-like n=1 Tax=Penaeus chinensis TaxID=139456 RepID=UPI001FB5D2A8|nr:carbohydrate sulfotransferase 9-like [Penaeus chinensis]XP_047487486.1 carbohydrate sulfotransferase 9-like [Penaeus chinensis]
METLRWKCNCLHSPLVRSLLLRARKRAFILLACGGFLLFHSWFGLQSGLRRIYLDDRIFEGDDGSAEESYDVTQRLLDRKENLLQKCSEMEGKLENRREDSGFKSMVKAKLLYNAEYKLMVCVVTKAGASTWRRHMLTLLGLDEEDMRHTRKYAKLIEANKMIGNREMKDVLLNPHTTWVMNTRHPLERLVSTYRDKFMDGNDPEEERLIEYVKWTKRDEAFVNNSITFPEFLDAVVLDNEWNGRAGMYHYLRPSSTVCSPCVLSYDYIIRTETFSEDLNCIANKLQLEGIDPALRVNNKSGGSHSSKYREYYKGIPSEVLRGIYFIYEEDFFLFGFDLPPFLLVALREW